MEGKILWTYINLLISHQGIENWISAKQSNYIVYLNDKLYFTSFPIENIG